MNKKGFTSEVVFVASFDDPLHEININPCSDIAIDGVNLMNICKVESRISSAGQLGVYFYDHYNIPFAVVLVSPSDEKKCLVFSRELCNGKFCFYKLSRID